MTGEIAFMRARGRIHCLLRPPCVDDNGRMTRRHDRTPDGTGPNGTGPNGIGPNGAGQSRIKEARCGDQRFSGPSFAALDLGTNNCRMLVGTPAGGGFRVVDSYSRIVRLGEGLHHTGALCPTAMDRAVAALSDCAERLARSRPRMVRAIATEACRRATNGSEFLERVRLETGLDVGVISTREEAELALESCTPLLDGGGRRALLFDIGGGSTELAWVRLGCGAPSLIGYASLPVGVVTLSERFGPAVFTEEGFNAMVDDVTARLTAFENVHCIGREIRDGGVRLLGTSGTVTTLASVVLNLERYRRTLVDGIALTRMEADDALSNLRALDRDALARHPCVGPERADFVMPGCAIYAAIASMWPAPDVVVADRGLREGMLLRMMRADRAKQDRRRNVLAKS
jgi:exopolyphosphatase / guanosine-5'-triphosphate,3'-diphosphate pyrophosphatase